MPQKELIKLDPSKNLQRKFIFPDMLPSMKFLGFQNRDDASQSQGAFVVGYNVKMSGNSLPAIRDGYEAVGTEAANATPVQRAWVFERRDETQIELKTYSTFVVAWVQGVSTQYAILKGGFTSGLEFGFANIGQTDQTFNWVFFGNGTENTFRWTGAYGQYASDNGSNQITLSGAITLANLGFTATGTIIINGVEITYTGLSGQTFTGTSAVPAGPTVGDMIFQSPVELTGVAAGGTDPGKFNVAMAHDGRLHYRDAAKKSVSVYSKLDNPDDITPGATDGDGGTKEIEFGGPITAYGKLNNVLLIFKERLIKSLDFIQHGDRVDSPRYTTIVPGDDKSTTIGGVNQRATFSTPYGQVFITPDKRMLLLTGVTGNNQPEYLVLSDPIQPLFTLGIHTDACGICVDNIIWYAYKADSESTYNDTVLRGDMTRRTIDKDGKTLPIQWDAPYVGWNVKDWTAVFNDDLLRNEVRWHSSLNSNTYRVTPDSKTDNPQAGNDGDFTASIRTHAETFGFPTDQKRISSAWVEIKMSENTDLLAALLYDEDGVTEQNERDLSGDSEEQKFGQTSYNPFGVTAFGLEKFGSNESTDDLPRYRFEFDINSNLLFFNISMQISSTGPAQNWEIVRYGYTLQEVLKQNDSKFLV